MAKHNVFITLPERELGKKDANFTILKDGEIFGYITISKGAIEWFPKKVRKNPYKLSWSDFDRAIREYWEK